MTSKVYSMTLDDNLINKYKDFLSKNAMKFSTRISILIKKDLEESNNKLK